MSTATAEKKSAKVGKNENGNGGKQLTIGQLAKKMDVEYSVANGLMNYMVTKKLAKDTKELAPNPAGKGRGSRIFSVPERVEIKLF